MNYIHEQIERLGHPKAGEVKATENELRLIFGIPQFIYQEFIGTPHEHPVIGWGLSDGLSHFQIWGHQRKNGDETTLWYLSGPNQGLLCPLPPSKAFEERLNASLTNVRNQDEAQPPLDSPAVLWWDQALTKPTLELARDLESMLGEDFRTELQERWVSLMKETGKAS